MANGAPCPFLHGTKVSADVKKTITEAFMQRAPHGLKLLLDPKLKAEDGDGKGKGKKGDGGKSGKKGKGDRANTPGTRTKKGKADGKGDKGGGRGKGSKGPGKPGKKTLLFLEKMRALTEISIVKIT